MSTIQPFTVILMHTGASPFFNYSLPKYDHAKKLWISEKDANSWDFFELNFSPTIYPPIICLKRLFSATCEKKEIPDNNWLSGICLIFLLFSVIQLGLEPRTPTLKVLCSTCWATESILYAFFRIAGAKVEHFFRTPKHFKHFSYLCAIINNIQSLIYGWR